MKKIFFVLAAFATSLTLSACGGPGEFVVTGTERAAGADGMITVEEIEGGNHLATISVNHLPPPDRLGEGLTTYIVWFTPEGGSPTMASPLEFDGDDRLGTATATTPQRRFTVLITAERNRNVTSPSETVVVRRAVRM